MQNSERQQAGTTRQQSRFLQRLCGSKSGACCGVQQHAGMTLEVAPWREMQFSMEIYAIYVEFKSSFETKSFITAAPRGQ